LESWLTFKGEVVKVFSDYLSNTLPIIGGEKWRELYVLESLSSHETQNMRIVPDQALHQLNFAALIRVGLASSNDLMGGRHALPEFSSHLSEMKKIHNRYAHAPIEGVPSI
jgi:hypothetical protein